MKAVPVLREFLFCTLLCASIVLGSSAKAAAEEELGRERTNIVLILADQLSYGDIEPYGVPDIRTPNLSRLAREGVRLTDFYGAAPVCTPSRAALLTGRYPQRAGMEKNVMADDPSYGLSPSEITVAQLLRDAGYSTALFGKWHLGHEPQFGPNRHGFDTFFGFHDWTIDYYSHRTHTGEPGLYENMQHVEKEGYVTDLLTERAVSFVNHNAGRPFFLFLSYNAVLPPYQPPDRPDDVRTRETWHNGTREDYAQMVERVDHGVGRILEILDRKELTRNTLVIFTSDHGGEKLSRKVPLFHGFGSLWEGGIRVPCLIRYPGRLPGGESSTQSAISMDLAASILSAARVSPPRERILDGIDLLPILAKEIPPQQRTLFWRFEYTGRNHKAVRKGDWKLLRDAGMVLLFNLGDDPGERNDLAYQEPEKRVELLDELRDWETEME